MEWKLTDNHHMIRDSLNNYFLAISDKMNTSVGTPHILTRGFAGLTDSAHSLSMSQQIRAAPHIDTALDVQPSCISPLALANQRSQSQLQV
jgi:hypothetical protein